jgi:hypothetical protein
MRSVQPAKSEDIYLNFKVATRNPPDRVAELIKAKAQVNSSGKTKKEAIVWGPMQKKKPDACLQQTARGGAMGEGLTRQRAT